ncbi:putative amino-acid permease [Lachnellula willkommii]|uniref:Putative amino-acid permease n=1 Tax=Lachnellula willkommii TaxID=215461 RepID=A0A559M701_9HELO|nr:putative amino-acid permease [Lachnellula willkommii]
MSEHKSHVNVDSEKAPPPHLDATPETEKDTHHELDSLTVLGYTPELHRNRSLFTLLFQTLAIAAIPYGEGGPLISAIYGGGQLSIFVGWLVVLVLITATVAMYHPDFVAESWQLLLIFYAICLASFVICAFGNKFLPMVDTICAAWTLLSILIILIALSVKADVGRHSAAYALGHYDTSLSGWGGFTFFIGLLPAAYTFSAIGMIASMAEEVADPTIQVPRALSLCVPVGGLAGLFFIIPICATLPNLTDILTAPSGQAIPYIFHIVMGSPGGGLGLTFLVLGVTLFCSISITNAASRCTWAFARDKAIPGYKLFTVVNTKLGVPVYALALVTIVQMLLGLINLGSSSAFTAFVSVGVIALAVSYAIPIGISLLWNKRVEVNQARWNCGHVIGTVVNWVSLLWIGFEVVLFSMPTALPVTVVSMNYAIVVLMGFLAISAVWYGVYARKVYNGPPASDGLS